MWTCKVNSGQENYILVLILKFCKHYDPGFCFKIFISLSTFPFLNIFCEKDSLKYRSHQLENEKIVCVAKWRIMRDSKRIYKYIKDQLSYRLGMEREQMLVPPEWETKLLEVKAHLAGTIKTALGFDKTSGF